ncbi:MAG TPA: hydroxymyristoyl-ACP dehydratase [Paludibacteraceae bacterium]|nr:hydroxymyristoyl-ACP dehydratase [Paludibacteraceae bacterium]HOU67893.1 hydroxymyristoyl-ACP dehydratase [Paludibacteraceae bacterium]HPH62291.1 hydroxymyristoyl-ACP dehydratase [Paludibacteraceae bacterium]HQF49799.1 hydroxymyristoyl-ACP dehydratase [Paludibacteraceae bacterium]HQJ89499.1 hydroxymyristoyl-ACP dehydratase [Paludibacteraceae bacterium]
MGVFGKALIEGDNILELIPQRPPIVMVDAFYGMDDVCSYSGLTVQADNIFFEKGKLREPGLIEHTAQSAAARVGYVCKRDNKPVPVGFIGGLKNFKINRLPLVNEKLCTTIKVEQEIMGVTLISSKTQVGDEVISESEMKIFLNEDQEK